MFWVFLAVVVLIILVGATYYNALSSKRGRCDEAWRELRARLDRRGALIDTLCETLRSATQGQEATIEKLQAARDAAADETDDVLQRVQAEHVVDEQFAAAFALVRQYPALHANAQFAGIREEHTGVSNRIAAAREAYNTAVDEYNEALTKFPEKLVARVFHFEPRVRFEIPAQAPA